MQPDHPTDEELKLAEHLFLLLDIAFAAATKPEDPTGWQRWEEAVRSEVTTLEEAQAMISVMLAQQAVALAHLGQSPSVVWADFYARWGERLRRI